ncbi:MAG: AbrB/MazE/SpoVT family DNA-binding domain-containing protein [Solirubrobacterales bacterium]
MTTAGRVVIPQSVRDALDLKEGDEIVFEIGGSGATIRKRVDFIAMAGSVPVPAGVRGAPWDEIIRKTYEIRYGKRR